MPTIEEIHDVRTVRQGGLVRELTRAYMVGGLTSTNGREYAQQVNQFSGINRGFIAFSGYPLVYDGETMETDGLPSGQARVVAKYTLRENGRGIEEELMGVQGQFRSSLKYVSTPFLADGSTQITVSHTWPSDAPGLFPNGQPRKGQTETQSGHVTVPKAIKIARGPIFRRRTRDQIDAILDNIVGKVNDATFLNKPARTYLCTEAIADIIDSTVTPWLWKLDLAFAYDSETWDNDTTVTFIDPHTGQPPSGLVVGTGIKKLQVIGETNFVTQLDLATT